MQEFTNSFDQQRFGLRQQVPAGGYKIISVGVIQAQWATTPRGELVLSIGTENKDAPEYQVAVPACLRWHTQRRQDGSRQLILPERLEHNSLAIKLRELLSGVDTLGAAVKALQPLVGRAVTISYSQPYTLFSRDGRIYDTVFMLIDLK